MRHLPAIGLCVSWALSPFGALAAQAPLAAGRTPQLPRSAALVLEVSFAPELASQTLALLAALPDAPARLTAMLKLVPIGAKALTGGVELDAALQALAPGRARLALLLRGGEPEPVFVAATDPAPEAQAVRARLWKKAGERLAVWDEGGTTIVAASQSALDAVRDAQDGRAPTLAALPAFVQWSRNGADVVPAPGLRLFVDLDALRARDLDRRPLWDRLDPLGRILLGPLAAAIDAAHALDVALSLDASGLALTARVDGSPLAQEPQGDAISTRLLASPRAARALPAAPADTIATLALDRGLRALFSDARALFGEAVEAQLRGGLSIADSLLGASFVDVFLPSLGEPLTLFVVAQPPVDPGLGADVDLPGFVLVAPLHDPKRATTLLRRGLGTLAIASNAERMRQGKLPFTLRSQNDDAGRLRLVFEPVERHGPLPAPVDVTLTPTIALGAKHVVFASTRETADAALRALDAQGDAARAHGDRLDWRPIGVGDYLARNQALAVLDAVLKRGVSTRQASREIDELVAVLRGFERASLALEYGVGVTTLRLSASLREPSTEKEMKR